MRSPPVYSHVYLIRLDLPDRLDKCPQMILERIARDTCENINEPVVAQSGKKSLFIIQGVHAYDSRSGIRDFRLRKRWVRLDVGLCHGRKGIEGLARRPDYPFKPFGSFLFDALWKRISIPKGVYKITDVLWRFEARRRGC